MAGDSEFMYFKGMSRAALFAIATMPDGPYDDARAFHTRQRQARAAAAIIQKMDEDRLQEIASEQLSALVMSDFASMDHEDMADTAVSLAKALAKRLDKESQP